MAAGAPAPDPAQVVAGRIAGVYGVRGWVRVQSYTDPAGNLLSYTPWYLGPSAVRYEPLASRTQGKGLVVQLAGVADRDSAAALVGADIRVARAALGEAPAGQYFWADLEGLAVRHVNGQELGRVERVMATGANDVLVVTGERRRLIPFVSPDVVRDVDLEARLITVDWDPDF